MEYRIIDRTEVPSKQKDGLPGKWQQIFDPIEYHQAVQIEVKSFEEARNMAQSIARTLKVAGADYKIHYRSTPNGSSYRLYIWKERNNEI